MKAKLLTVTGLLSVLMLALYTFIGLMYASPALMKGHEDVYIFLWKSAPILYLPFFGSYAYALYRQRSSKCAITAKSDSLADIKN